MMFFRKSAKMVIDKHPKNEFGKISEEEMEKVETLFSGKKPLNQYQGLEEPVLEEPALEKTTKIQRLCEKYNHFINSEVITKLIQNPSKVDETLKVNKIAFNQKLIENVYVAHKTKKIFELVIKQLVKENPSEVYFEGLSRIPVRFWHRELSDSDYIINMLTWEQQEDTYCYDCMINDVKRFLNDLVS
ncbi:glycine--tRNA ligase, beta subunit [Ligilactobacillus equi DPC 6820]|uniref:Glycine--tRNA ligase, beta subunit n=2 Tax=Ligilactobacillus equi TaxID=137357 RepID=V7HX24_9LACO|nr:glycine--tRNA ligase, beta subunit [Ligilactobacillus equi DPC 6820]